MRIYVELCVYYSVEMTKLTVLLDPRLSDLFQTYCDNHGYKKSPLVARLIRDYLRSEGFAAQSPLFQEAGTLDTAPRKKDA
jgi:hypothetical protein